MIPTNNFSPPAELGGHGGRTSGSGRRSATLNAAPPVRRYSALSGNAPQAATIAPHRRVNSSHVAPRANNIASLRTSASVGCPVSPRMASNPPRVRPSSAGAALPPPPAYSPRPVSTIPETIAEAPPRVTVPGGENALEMLKGYDTIFLVDDSGSMAGALWNEAGKALAGVARVASQYDDDGIDIYFLNSRDFARKVTSGETVRELFTRVQPRGSTPTGARLDAHLRSYLSSIERAQQELNSTDPEVTGIKPINFIVITDGAPSDDPESVIVAAAKRLDKHEFPLNQLGIQFVQIGRDPEATQALAELDDDLAGTYGVRDIVDTTPYNSRLDGEMLVKILLGGINKRVDKRGGAAVMRR